MADETEAPLTEWHGLKGQRRETSGNGLDKTIVFAGSLQDFIRKPEESGKGEKISPEVLYGKTVLSDQAFETPKILQIREIIQECINRSSDALIAQDEIVRESEMNLVAEGILELAPFIRINRCFKDAICLVTTAVQAHTKRVYSRPHIVALQKALSLLRDNVYMDEDKVHECADILEDAGFDINAPFEGVELAI